MKRYLSLTYCFINDNINKVLKIKIKGLYMALKLILTLIGGFGLFMYGMKAFSDGLQNTAQNTIKDILFKITKNKILGISFGFLLTALVQSSSAVTVMTVSFVNANIMNLAQAVNVILGANIGTTVTGWIISLNINVLALPAIGIGTLLVLFAKRKAMHIGYVIMGFGMLFYGLFIMREAFMEVRSSESFRNIFLMVNAEGYLGRLTCILIGAGVTAIIQSSSATLGVTISLASAGLIDYPTAVAFILGENIGTTITANLATIGASTNSKRASLIHFMFNFIGVTYMYFLFPYYIKFVDVIIKSDVNLVVDGIHMNVSYHIAAAHTIFNVFNVILFFFFTKQLAKLSCLIYKNKEEEKHVSVLSDKLLNMPVSAEIEVKKEVIYMADISCKMINRIKHLFETPNDRILEKIKNHEKMLDNMDRNIHGFLLKLIGRNTQNMTDDLTNLISVSTYYENLGDNLKDIGIAVIKCHEKKSHFHTIQKNDILEMLTQMEKYIKHTEKIFDPSYNISKEKIYFESKKYYVEVKEFYYEIRQRHFKEVEGMDMPPLNAHLYGDVLVYFNRSLTNIKNIIEVWTGKDN